MLKGGDIYADLGITSVKVPTAEVYCRTRGLGIYQSTIRGGRKMKRNAILSLIILVIFSLFLVPCWAEEKKEGSTETPFFHDFIVHGFLRYEPSFHIGGRNFNNEPLQTENNTLNLSRSWLQIEPEGKLGENIRFYGKFRFINESAENLDDNLHRFDAFPIPFSGNGWMLQVGKKRTTAEVWELFTDVDIKALDLAFRIGKQTVAWGEPIAIRVFDVVNSLDLRWHAFFEPAMDEFENIRIPMWGLKVVKKIPTGFIACEDTFFEAFISPTFFPQILPALGSPYNLLPSFIKVDENMPDNRWVFAGRFNTTFRGLGPGCIGLSFMYVNKPVDAAVLKFKGLEPDPVLGIPVIPGVPTLFRIVNSGEHPRVNIVGASANYYIDPLKLMIRGEMTYTLDQPYQKAPSAADIEKRGTYNAVLILERNFKWSEKLDSLMVGLQFFETYIQGNKETILINNAMIPRKNTQSASIYLSQPFKQFGNTRLPLGGLLTTDFLFLYDFDKAFWMQPGIRYDVGSHWRFNVFANIFKGRDNGELAGRIGALHSANEIFMRLTYGF